MNTSPAGRAFIESQEGLVLFPYRDQLGYPTIGYGHRIGAGQYPQGINMAQAVIMLSDDLRVAEGGVQAHVDVALPQGIFDALVDLCHNCGPACLVGTKCLADLNAGDFDAARAEFMGFVHGAGVDGVRVTLPVLVARRQAAVAQLWDAA